MPVQKKMQTAVGHSFTSWSLHKEVNSTTHTNYICGMKTYTEWNLMIYMTSIVVTNGHRQQHQCPLLTSPSELNEPTKRMKCILEIIFSLPRKNVSAGFRAHGQ